MKSAIRIIICAIVFGLISCYQTNDKKYSKYIVHDRTEKPKFVPNEKYLTKHSDTCGCSAQFELKDSLKLVHVKGQFYKSPTGHLYERTVRQQDINEHVVDHEYFNGYFSQDVDPLTFEPLEGWYAKDKNYVYYYRPVSGGMQISKMVTADIKTFKLLAGHYKYAMDQKYFYNETEIITSFIPSKTKQTIDNKGRVIEMTYKNKIYKLEIVE